MSDEKPPFRSPDQERADYVEKRRSMTAADKTDRERARGAEVAAANAKKFEEAEAERAKEEADAAAAADPNAPPANTMQTDFEKAAGAFPVAGQPIQPDPVA